MKLLKRIVKSKIFLTLIILFLAGIIFTISFRLKCSSAQPDFKPFETPLTQEQKEVMAEYLRTEETTYISFPEWYLVFNPQEYAEFIEKNPPSHFPYFSSIGQFWTSYCRVYGMTNKNYPFNAGDHLTISVIGVSFTLEYAVKGIYENTLGRLTEWIGSYGETDEDKYAAKVAKAYGDFIPTDPWYEFPYGQALTNLWKKTNFWGEDMIRKSERKVFLSLEYGIKKAYAYLIKLGTKSVYGTADTKVYAIVKSPTEEIFKIPDVHKIKTLTDGSYLITLPHYQGFTDIVPDLAKEGVEFINVSGNDEILLSALAPADWNYNLEEGNLLFTQKILTHSDMKRIVVQVPVQSMSEILNALGDQSLKVEHLFDY